MADNLDLALRIRADLQRAREQLRAAERDVLEFGNSSQKAGKGVDRFNRNLSTTERRMRGVNQLGGQLRSTLAGIAGIAFFSRQARQSLEFEQSLSRIVGLVGVARSEVNQMREGILEMGPEVARGPNELAEALFFITSAGARGQVAMDILRASAEAATAGLGETKTVADAVTSAINAYGAESLSASRATDVLTATVREGKAEASSLAGQFGGILPFAEELGIGFDQVGAALAFLTRTTGDASKAGTQLRGILSKLVKPTTTGRKEFQRLAEAGFDIRKVIQEEGLLSALIQLRERLGVNSEGFTKIFEDAEAFVGVLQLTGDQSDIARGIFDRLKNSTGALNDAFKAGADDGLRRLNSEQAELDAAMADFNEQTLPALIGGLGWLTRKANDVANEIRTLTEVFAGLFSGAPGTEISDLDTAITQVERKLEGGLLSRTGIFTLDGELQFHLSEGELEAELQRLKDRRDALLKEMGFAPMDNEDEPLGDGGSGGDGDGEGNGDGGGDGEGKGDDGGDGDGDNTGARVDKINKVIAALREEADTYGMSAEQQSLYRLQKLGATKAQIEQARALHRDLALKKADAEHVERQMEKEEERLAAIRKSREAYRELVAELEGEMELLQMTERERFQETASRRLSADATDKQRQSIRELAGELFDMREAAKESTEDMSVFWEQASRNMQDAFANFLRDPFEEGLEGMVASFADALQRMAAEAAAARIFDAIGSWGQANSGGGSGGLMNTLASAAASMFGGGGQTGASVQHRGGMAGSGPSRMVPTLAFANAPRLDVGGIIGPGEIPAVLHRDEEVLTADDPRNARNGGDVPITVENRVFTRDPDTRVESRASRARSRQRELKRDERYL